MTLSYDDSGNRTYSGKNVNGKLAEYSEYSYNNSNQMTGAKLYDGKKTTTVSYAYDANGNLVSETGKKGTDKVETTYQYTVENRLKAVYDGKELLMAVAYDGDGNRIFQLNYNLHTDDDFKGSSGNGNGNNKDNSGSGQNNNGILIPEQGEVSGLEQELIDMVKTAGKQKDYELWSMSMMSAGSTQRS